MNRIDAQCEAEENAEIDLTPMLDVVFIMLIFFIVTASFIREVSIEVERPPAASPPANSEEDKNLVVYLLADNQIMIEGRMVDHRSLRAYFERHRASHPDAALIIKASTGSKTYAFTRISDAARQAGMFQVVLANGK